MALMLAQASRVDVRDDARSLSRFALLCLPVGLLACDSSKSYSDATVVSPSFSLY